MAISAVQSEWASTTPRPAEAAKPAGDPASYSLRPGESLSSVAKDLASRLYRTKTPSATQVAQALDSIKSSNPELLTKKTDFGNKLPVGTSLRLPKYNP